MAEMWTPQQRQAVKDRGGKLLVSAAAGSGKTKVLVDRLMDYLLDPVQPANLDEFLIITYTKAAASELRGKIAAKLSEHMACDPENRHLQHQMQRLYLTKISTVHAFCGDILREYAYKMDLPADFRVADENECTQLRQSAMDRMLDDAYEHAHEDGDFRAFVDGQGLGRDDRLVPEILLKVYDSARCHLQPEQWLERCVSNTDVTGVTDAAKTIWGAYLAQELHSFVGLQIDAMEKCVALAERAEGMEKVAALLSDTVAQLRTLQSSETWDELVTRLDVSFGTLRFPKNADEETAERIKAVRNACKKGLEKKRKIFTDTSAVVLEDMAATTPAVRGIAALVRRFDREYSQAKQSRRILDFGDLEHRMLDLLLGKHRTGPTSAAKEIGRRFREIMVDEYQDSNAVQDAIFGALSQERQNCFMVGDVKQSIYQFRLADPGIFLKKYHDFADAGSAKAGEGRKVLLSANFRSGGAVLRSVNDIFAQNMSPAVGGLYYGAEEALHEGLPHGLLGEAEVELLAVDVRESTYHEEAAVVAERIRELLDGSHYVRQGEELRPIRPEDIVILLRSPGSVGGYYIDALEKRGIRCTSGGGEDLLKAPEICVLRSLLQTISNPRQDIALIGALANPVFGFTADDLAAIRANRRWCSMYDALCASEIPKAKDFLKTLAIHRKAARIYPLAQLMEQILQMTRMDSFYNAVAGSAAGENLRTFCTMAGEFESGGRRDLEQFLEHLDALEDKGLVMTADTAAGGCVTMMSIHKSKGLEFPVVFVSGLGREFNRESARAQVLCDQELGLGLSVVDARNRLRYPTMAKRAIAAKITADCLSEELRVLYVALTRARDRLIMTYASQNLARDLSQMVQRMDITRSELMTKDVVCPGEWVLMTALRRTEAGSFFRVAGRPEKTALGDPVWKIEILQAMEQAAPAPQADLCTQAMPEGMLEKLRQGLAFRYAHDEATQTPSKQTATQRKGRPKDAEAAQDAPQNDRMRPLRRPTFLDARPGDTDRGTAMHRAMQYLDLTGCVDLDAVCQRLDLLVEEGRLTAQQRALVDEAKIQGFLESELGRKLRESNELLREFKFSILDPAEHDDPALTGELVLLQGVVDCAIMESDGITIIDFKTDRVTEETVCDRAEHYRGQVRTYADAMARIWERPVKRAVLYFFALERIVDMI